ncbi:MAG: tetraacyldisaccharide 4'-kinase [Bacteroidaceae bacterium]|nr:tetraacyldisaccharide 4'-kinase [Bacteroidaceae bacterium]
MKFLLYPISWIYGIVISIRNHLFDTNVLKRRSYNIPIISVGNITMCGTGKTPHTEYILQLLKSSCKIAVLSRGYKRLTKGYVLATDKTDMQDIGDEPFQIHQKFPDVTVAVCEKRCDGVDRLLEEEKVEAVVLDDAFQHRYIEPGLNILLVDFNRPIARDHLLPVGMLREPASSKKRADIIIITKCPQDISPLDIRVATNDMRMLAFQKLFFSTIDYAPLKPLFDKELAEMSLLDLKKMNVLLVTAIGSPDNIVKDLEPYGMKFKELHYQDHHQFTEKEVYEINETFSFMPSPKIMITTEKDATRLQGLNGFSLDLRKSAYILPITVRILQDKEDEFNQIILDYVHKDATAITQPSVAPEQQPDMPIVPTATQSDEEEKPNKPALTNNNNVVTISFKE